MINTPLLSTGALRIAKGSGCNLKSGPHSQQPFASDATKHIRENWWQDVIDSKKYEEMEVHYINPSEIVDIVEVQARQSGKYSNLPKITSTTIHLRGGEKITTDSGITREKIIECANVALQSGKVIDLIA